MNTLIPVDILSQTIQRIEGAYAPATIRAFRADFNTFIAYCQENQTTPLPTTPPSTVSNHIDHLSSGKFTSAYIRRILVSISTIHKLNRFEDPTKDCDVQLAMRRMHRKLGRSSKQDLSVKDYIGQKVPRLKEENPNHFSPSINVKFIFLHERPIIPAETLDEAIKSTELAELKRAAEWYSNEISRFIRRNQKIADFQKLLEMNEFATTPDLDQLDRLMRYQTTLQRQLSTAIGELLALTKN